MRSNRIIGLLTKMFLVVSLLFGVVTITGTTAEAQHRHRHGRIIIQSGFYPRTFYPRSYWYNGVYFAPGSRVTEGQGYSAGKHDGKDDAKDRKGYDPSRHHDYRDAQTSAYLDGYTRGYEDGFRERAG